MENFIVSARKYRPQHFNTVVGQSHITNTLKNAITGKHLAQAYLFCGPRGVGKTTCARIFAKTINCFEVRPDGEACDQCESCKSFNAGTSLNIYELDAASNNSVDDIRNLVDQVRFAPQLGKYKVYIIDEVHMLSAAAFNAFLKTLEEPPAHAKFILATTEKHKIIPTILSRCQIFNFNRIKTEDISRHLEFLAKSEEVKYEQEALNIIAQKADGGLRDACSIFDQMIAFTGNVLTYKQVVENLHVLDHDYYFTVTDAFLVQGMPKIMLTFDEILKKGFDSHNFLIGLGEHLRNLLVCKDPQTLTLLEVSDALKKRFAEQAAKCETTFLLKALALISRTDVNYKSARNQRLLIEMALLQLTYLTASQDAEKKDESEPFVIQNPAPEKIKTTGIAVPTDPVIKIADRPGVHLQELKLKTGFDLNELRNIGKNGNQDTEKKDETGTFENKGELSEAGVKEALRSYSEGKQKEGSLQLYTTLTSCGISFNDNMLTLTLTNESQREKLQLLKQELLDDLRRTLNDNRLGLEIKLNHDQVQQKVFKPADIYRNMSEKNPALAELKKRFDLEIDY